MFALRYLALPLLLLSISASLFAKEAKPTREEGSARNRGSRQDAQADHAAPDHPKVDVYCCAVQTYRPWLKRPAPPRDYNPYHFSAHVEVYLPELGVAYLPASGSLFTADRKRYSEPTSEIVGHGRRTFRATRIPGLTLTAESLKDILQKHKTYLEKESAPNKSAPGTPILDKKWSAKRLRGFLKREMKDEEVLAGRGVLSTSATDCVQYQLADGRFLVLVYYTGKLQTAGFADEPYHTTAKLVELDLGEARKPALNQEFKATDTQREPAQITLGEEPVPAQTKIDPSVGYLRLHGMSREVDSRLLSAARAKRSNDQDIRSVETGHYIGGIDRRWGLVIGPPPARQFHYWFWELSKARLSGTYEIKDGLAIFSGELTNGRALGEAARRKGTTRSLRFGLNYAFLGEEVHFNLLVPDKDGLFHYRRKWFRRLGDEWKPSEEHRLTFIPGESSEEALVFAVKGKRLRWDQDGQAQSDEIDVSATYQSPSLADYYRLQPGKASWLPPLLWPRVRDNGQKGHPAFYRLSGSGFGQVRGFTFGNPPAITPPTNTKHSSHEQTE